MSETPKVDGIMVTFPSAGNADWIREVVVPLASDVEEIASSFSGEIPPPLRRMKHRSGAVNAGIGTTLLFGLTIFVASTLGAKGLGDFYDVLLKPRVRKFFKNLDKRITGGGNIKTPKTFNSAIWYGEYQVLVSVSVTAKTMAEIEAQLDIVDEVHANARELIAKNGAKAPVLYYKIEAGKVNTRPLLAERLDEIV